MGDYRARLTNLEADYDLYVCGPNGGIAGRSVNEGTLEDGAEARERLILYTPTPAPAVVLSIQSPQQVRPRAQPAPQVQPQPVRQSPPSPPRQPQPAQTATKMGL
jgi:hypothetical protein